MRIFQSLTVRRSYRCSATILGFILLLGSPVLGSTLTTPNGPHPDQTPQRDSLLNGLRIATLQRSSDRVAVVCAIRAGAMFDPLGKGGLANITAGLLLYGAGTYSEDRIQAELDEIGGKITITTDWDGVWIEAEGPPARLNVLFDLISLMVTTPRFTPEDLEKAKQVARQHIAADQADPASIADRAFAKALFGKHTYGRDIWGDEASLAAITIGDVKFFHSRFFGSNSSILSVVGPTSSDDVFQLARARFGRWEKKKIVPATFLPPEKFSKTRVYVVDSPKAPNPLVRAGLIVAGRKQPDTAPIKVVSDRYAEALTLAMPMARDVFCTYDLRTLDSPFVCGFSVPVSDLDRSLGNVEAAMAEMQKPRDTAASSSGKIYFPTTPDAAMVEARGIAEQDFFSAQSLARNPSNYSVDETKVANAARTVLKPAALTIVIVGNAAEITAALKERYTVEVLPAS